MIEENRLVAWITEFLFSGSGDDPRSIDLNARFSQLGLDSAGTISLISALSQFLGRKLPATLLWHCPTPNALIRHLCNSNENGERENAATARAVAQREPVAIVGAACRLPGAATPAAWWNLLARGVDAIQPIPSSRFDADAYFNESPQNHPGTMNTRWGSFLDDVAGFDPAFFGISPREAVQMDPQQRLMLELAWELLEDGGIPAHRLANSRTGVFIGTMWHDYEQLLAGDTTGIVQHTATGHDNGIIAARIAYFLGLMGPAIAVNTACSSSLTAVHLACESIRSGETSLAFAGGINLVISPNGTIAMSQFGGMSPDGRTKAFDARANGYVRGEGAGLIMLEPLSLALRRGHRIYATIEGTAINNDGFSNGLTAPNPKAQADLLQTACANGGLSPAAVDYVEAHGTGTRLGDPLEAGALGEVLGTHPDRTRALVIGSAKTNIGHLEAAAGIAGLLKTMLAVSKRQIPPSLHFQTPNPQIDFQGLNLRVPTSLEPWPHPGPAVAGVSSFGFGGVNCHVLLKEWRPPMAIAEGDPLTDPKPALQGPVFVFSGQGGQWPGMGCQLLREAPAFRFQMEACDRAYQQITGNSLIQLLDSAREDQAWRDNLQPLIFSMQMALAAFWRDAGFQPAAVIGHSFGEIAAACVSGRLSLPDAMQIAVQRGRQTAKVAGQGGLLVVDGDLEQIQAMIQSQPPGNQLALAAINGPGNIVVSGTRPELAALTLAADRKKIRYQYSQVEYAAHGPQMEALAEGFAESIRPIQPLSGKVPMFSSLLARSLEDQPLDVDYWTQNLQKPVLFQETIQNLLDSGYRHFLEISPHPMLEKAIQAIADQRQIPLVLASSTRRDEEKAEYLRENLAKLRQAGLGNQPQPALFPGLPLLLSAHNPEALRQRALAMTHLLTGPGAPALNDLCATAARNRQHLKYRLSLYGRNAEELRTQLDEFLGDRETADLASGRTGNNPPRIAFVFPGQGSQWSGMGRELMAIPVFERAICRCERAFAPYVNWSLIALIKDNNDRWLAEVTQVQPALFAIQVALAELWRSWGVVASAVVGHSMGEVAAAHVAGALSLEDAARIICLRSQIARRSSGRGAMAVVSLAAEEIRPMLDEYRGQVEIAAWNGPQNLLISGETGAVANLLQKLQARDIFCRPVAVDYASHCAQMDPLKPQLLAALEGIQPQGNQIPFYSSVTNQIQPGEQLDAAYWVANLRNRVRFYEAIVGLEQSGIDTFLELSAHPVLTHAISQSAGAVNVGHSLERDMPEFRCLFRALGRLHCLGYPVDWNEILPPGQLVSLDTYPFQRQPYWLPARKKRDRVTQTGSPLLGEPLTSPLADYVFHRQIDPEDLPHLDEHRVAGLAVFPGTGFLEMALVAARESLGLNPVQVCEFLIHKPLYLTRKQPLQLQTVIQRQAGETSLTIYACHGGQQGPWETHASAILKQSQLEPICLADHQPLSQIEDVYPTLAARGLDYGPHFRGIARQSLGPAGSLAWLNPIQLPYPTSASLCHTLLDACLQSCFALMSPSGDEALYLPMGMDRVIYHGPGQPVSVRTVQVNRSDMGSHVFDLQIFDGENRLLMEMGGVNFARANGDNELASMVFGEWWQAIDPPQPGPRAQGAWLILAQPEQDWQTLAGRLRARNHQVHTLISGKTWLAPVDGSGELNPENPDHFHRLAHDLTRQGPLAGVICLWPTGLGPDLAPEDLEGEDQSLCSGALHLLQALADAASPRFWWITRGARAVLENERPAAAATMLWGLIRVAAQEYSHTDQCLIDLSPEASALENEREMTALVRLISESAPPSQYALRAGQLFQARLEHCRPESRQKPKRTGSFRLEPSSCGLLESMDFQSWSPASPAADQVLVRVETAGLNFRDVLLALKGALTGQDGPMGLECAGEVIAVGAAVTHCRPGDRVLGWGAGCFSDQVLLPATNVFPIPEKLDNASAASLPIAGLTAWYALFELGRLKPSDKVLIHAGTGGVGWMAVQLALQTGAEVYATAGSEAKRKKLRNLGVQLVTTSRELVFAEEVMNFSRGRGVDLVLNCLIGEFIEKSFEVLRPGGIFVEIGKRDIWSQERVVALGKGHRYCYFDLLTQFKQQPEWAQPAFASLAELVTANRIQLPPLTLFAMEQAAEAFKLMARAGHIGKIVLLNHQTGGLPLRADGTYLITGGTGPLGLFTAQHLAREGAGYLVLTSRSGRSQAIEPQLEAIRATGCQLLIRAVDVSDRDQMQHLFEELQQLPPLRGIIHGAGVLVDGILQNQDRSSFATVFAPKVRGAWLLNHLSQGCPLDFFICWSSTAALLGSPGQGNHSAANAFLDGLMEDRAARGLPGLSIQWGPWSEIGAAATSLHKGEDHWQKLGVGPVSPDQAWAIMKDLFNARTPRVAVFKLDAARYSQQVQGRLGAAFVASLHAAPQIQTQSASMICLRDQLAGLPEPEYQTRLLKHVAATVLKVLALPASAGFDPEMGFRQMGLDSLMAVSLRNLLRRDLEMELPTTLAFDYPNGEALTRFLVARLQTRETAVQTVPVLGSAQTSESDEDLDSSDLVSLINAELESLTGDL